MVTTNELRRCIICEKVKSLKEFYRNKYAYLGYSYRCKECSKEAAKIYYEKNRTLLINRSKDWNKKHPNAVSKNCKNYRIRCGETFKELNRKRSKDNYYKRKAEL